MKKRKLWAAALSLVMLVCLLAAVGCNGCGSKEPSKKAFLTVEDGRVEIGLEGVQTWKFERSGARWRFGGVYAGDERVFVGASGRLDEDERLEENGAWFSVQPSETEGDAGSQLDGYITDIRTSKDEAGEKQLLLTGKNFSSTLTAVSGEWFVQRDVTVTPEADTPVAEAEISFVLKTQVGAFMEKGFILTHNADVRQNSVPYSFPAVTSRLTGDKSFVYTDVMDWQGTDEIFKTARRNENLNGYLELGVLSSEGEFEAGKAYTLSENILVKDAGEDTFYDMIYGAREKYADLYGLPVEALAEANGNMNVSSWTDAAYGATYDILDARGRPLGDDAGTWGPYGYQNGGAEAFGSLDILKGMTRYAVATDDDALLATCEKYLLQFVRRNDYGTSYIMPLNLYYPGKGYTNDLYFYRAYNGDGKFSPEDSWNGQEPRIGAFKYYSRVINLGELALVTGNEEVKSAYLSLMPLVKKLRGENFEQDVEWNFDLTPCNMDYDNGGSAGAEAMWAQIMYIASRMQTDAGERDAYLELCKGSIAAANRQDFDKTSALREYPKPEAIGYAVKVNVELYRLTGKQEYLDSARKIVQGIHFYYFASTHPYTYFQTVGFGYADSRERWEAFMEMVESVVLLAPYLEYTDDPLLLDLVYTTQNAALWCLPANGYPEGYLGGHSDWLDALYVPFEQPTGALGDNPTADGGEQSYLRHSKELYGAGEIFTGALTFETFARSSDPLVSLFHLEAAASLTQDRSKHVFRLWNVSSGEVRTALSFPNLPEGSYVLKKDGKELGTYTAAQLARGVSYPAPGRTSALLSVESAGSGGGGSVSAKTGLVVASSSPSSTTFTLSGENASHFVVTAARAENASAGDAQTMTTTKNSVTIGHLPNEKLYIRAVGVTAGGDALEAAHYTLTSGRLEIGLLEDFGAENPADGTSIAGWTATAANYGGTIALLSDCNGFKGYPETGYARPAGYMAVYKPAYAGEDTDTFEKSFEVDLAAYPTLEFVPFTKNVGSTFRLTASAGGSTLELLETQAFDRSVYRFELSALAGKGRVTVRMISEGRARGFAVERLQFVRDAGEYDGSDTLDALGFELLGASRRAGAGLVLDNAADMAPFNREWADLGEISPDMTELEVLLGELPSDVKNRVDAELAVYAADDLEHPVYTGTRRVTSAGTLKVNVADIADSFSGRYTLKVRFTRLTTGEEVHTVRIRTVRFNGGASSATLDVTELNGSAYELAEGWKTNWANVNPATGFVYNNDPSKGYSSIYCAGFTVNLDETPLLQYTVSAVKDSQYNIKVNDGTMPTDLSVTGDSVKTGTFTVNLRDVLSRGGIASLRFDLYVMHDMSAERGVRFESLRFLESSTVYENATGDVYSEAVSAEFSVDLSKTPFLSADVADLTYGSGWMLWAELDGVRYELKTDYERVYGKMYTRRKQGAFKYDLRQVLGKTSGTVRLRLVAGLSGDGASVNFRSIRLASDNDLRIPRDLCVFR